MISGRIKITIAVSHQLELKITKDGDTYWYVMISSSSVVSNISFEIDWKFFLFRYFLHSFFFYICVSQTMSYTTVDSDFFRIQYTRSISTVRLHHERSCPVCQGKRLFLSRHVSGTRPYFLMWDGDEFCDLEQRRHSDPKYNHLVKKRQIWFVDDKTTRSDWVIFEDEKRRSLSTISVSTLTDSSRDWRVSTSKYLITVMKVSHECVS